MKKLTLILALSTVLGACSSPPDPVPFPKTKEVGISEFTQYKPQNSVPLNRFNSYAWTYDIIAQERYLQPEDNTKFWYLAHHASHITLSGEVGNVSRLKQRLISNGATAQIELANTCIGSKFNPCPDTVSIHFAKILPKPTQK